MKNEAIIKNKPEQPQRRTLLGRLWALLGLLACIEIGWLGSSIFKSRKIGNNQDAGSRFIDAGRVESLNPGDVKAIPEGMLYLCRLEDGSFIALSKTCTHLGCAVPWDRERQEFVCPCHGSSFARDGSVLSAPATRPLDYFPVRIENGLVRIDIANPTKRDSFALSQVTQA